MEELRVLSPAAILGYGFPKESFQAGVDRKPDVIAVDAGSTDPGPYYLGAGVSFTDRVAVKRDLAAMITAGRKLGCPVLIGTAGGSGADAHLAWAREIILEIARENDLEFKLAVIRAELDKDFLKERIRQARVCPLGPVGPLTEQDVDVSTAIVAQMGTEPFLEALQAGADVVLAGRAYDPAAFAALGIARGFDPGLALHMGKILECAAIAATPGSGRDCMMGILRRGEFILEPLSAERRCTPASVAAHTLYEKSDPYSLPGPGGTIDLHQAKFTALDERQVSVTGSRFIPTDKYAVKLEGARKVGYRTLCIAGTRDPIMIAGIDDIIAAVKDQVRENFDDVPQDSYSLLFRVYGKNAVMGQLEPVEDWQAHEIGIVIEAVAKTQELANTICSFARSTMLHYGYEGRISTAGNLAFPYSPSDIKAGEVFEFSVHHLLELDDPLEIFPVEIEHIKGGKR